MKSLPSKLFSFIGLLLVVASVVVSALEPSYIKKTKAVNGILINQHTDDGYTCTAVEEGALNCHNTASDGVDGSTSSGGGTASTTVTAGNTTTGDVS
jgi:hypothetical protein